MNDEPDIEDFERDDPEMDELRRRSGSWRRVVGRFVLVVAVIFTIVSLTEPVEPRVDLPDKVDAAQIGTWQVSGGSEGQRETFLRIVQSGDPSLRPIARDLASKAHVILADTKRIKKLCGWNKAGGCALLDTEDGYTWDQFDIVMDEQYMEATEYGQTLVWHELGHAVRAGIDADDAQTWHERAKKRNDGRFRINDGDARELEDDGKLDVAQELWADHFAMYAVGRDDTDYNYVVDDDSYSAGEVKRALEDYDRSRVPYDAYLLDADQ